MDATDDPEVRKREVIAEARARVAGPALGLQVLGGAEVVVALAAWALAHGDARPDVALIAVACSVTGPVALAAGWGARRLRGWNLVFAGCLGSGVGWGALSFAASVAPSVPALVALGLMLATLNAASVWVFARLVEETHVLAARRWLEPRRPGTDEDRGPW